MPLPQLVDELGLDPFTDWETSGFWDPVHGLTIEAPVFASKIRLPTMLGQFVHTLPLFRCARRGTPSLLRPRCACSPRLREQDSGDSGAPATASKRRLAAPPPPPWGSEAAARAVRPQAAVPGRQGHHGPPCWQQSSTTTHPQRNTPATTGSRPVSSSSGKVPPAAPLVLPMPAISRLQEVLAAPGPGEHPVAALLCLPGHGCPQHARPAHRRWAGTHVLSSPAQRRPCSVPGMRRDSRPPAGTA